MASEADPPSKARQGRRGRRLCPQVIQTSQMDCGPAAAKALLEGCGIPAAYGRLREACQTDVDGTAIGDLEELITQVGLPVEEVMEPLDHVLATERNLPAIAVVSAALGQTHFVVVWRCHGPFVQVMDPSTGRRFLHREAFERELFLHQHAVEGEAWREWAGTSDFIEPLARRLGKLGAEASGLIETFLEGSDWHSIAALDAATRLATVLAEARALPRQGIDRFLLELAEGARDEMAETGLCDAVPERFWSVWPCSASGGPSGEIFLRGAVLLRVAEPGDGGGEHEAAGDVATEDVIPGEVAAGDASHVAAGPLGEAMLRAVHRGDDSPWTRLLSLAGRRIRQSFAWLVLTAILTAGLAVAEALLLFGLIHAAGEIEGTLSLAGALIAALVFVLLITAFEMAVSTGSQHIGRLLELRVRTAFLRKIPRLGDRYLSSRLRSDMAERAHSVVGLRNLPPHLADLTGSAAGLLVTTLGLVLLFPQSAILAILLASCSVALPLMGQAALREPVTALRNHAGALSSYYLDALRGLQAIRAHRAEKSLRRGHGILLDHWLEKALTFNRRVALIDTCQTLIGMSLAAAMVFRHTELHGLGGGILLMTYWALALPGLGSAFAQGILRLPDFEAITGRFIEPISTLEESVEWPAEDLPRIDIPDGAEDGESGSPAPRGLAIRLEGVSAVASGHRILDRVTAEVRPGERIAVLGASGAGKSTLFGLLLGWHRVVEGRILIDGEDFDARSLRQRTAWVDPTITLWNRSLMANLLYGAQGESARISAICRTADLQEVVTGLPDGLASELGEDGGRLSGGEGQRARLGRALTRRGAELVILDEPFRGLEAERRGALLGKVFAWWKNATILCATHDLSQAERFDRVAILEAGQLVEIGAPEELLERRDSTYSRWMAREARRRDLWRGAANRHWSLVDGRVIDGEGIGPHGISGGRDL